MLTQVYLPGRYFNLHSFCTNRALHVVYNQFNNRHLATSYITVYIFFVFIQSTCYNADTPWAYKPETNDTEDSSQSNCSRAHSFGYCEDCCLNLSVSTGICSRNKVGDANWTTRKIELMAATSYRSLVCIYCNPRIHHVGAGTLLQNMLN